MSGDPSSERIVAVGLTVLIVLQPIVGVSGATGTTAVLSGDPRNTTVSVSAVADPGDTYDRVGVGKRGSTGSFVSLSGGAGTTAVRSTIATELGQAATPTPTPSPPPSTTPGTIGRSPGTEGLDPVLVLSGLIAVVLLALGVWFLLR